MSLATRPAGRGTVDEAVRALGVTPAAQFASLLYGGGAPDGLGAVSATWLAGNATAAHAFIAEKPRAGHKVHVRSAGDGPEGSGEPQGRCVVEILNDDMPFLVNSVMGELQARGLTVRQLLHPTFKTRRDAAGRLQAVLGPGDRSWNDGHQESYIAIFLAAGLSEAAQADLVGTLSAILDEVRAAVADWQPMLRLVETAARRLQEAASGDPAGHRNRRRRRRSCAGSLPATSRSWAHASIIFPAMPWPAISCQPRPVTWGSCAIPPRTCCRVAPTVPARHTGLRRSSSPKPARRAACTGAHTWTVSLSGPIARTAPSAAESASSGSLRRRRTRPRRATSPSCVTRLRRPSRRSGYPVRQPRRQGAPEHAGDVSARRAVPDRTSTICSGGAMASSISKFGRACASSRASIALTAS